MKRWNARYGLILPVCITALKLLLPGYFQWTADFIQGGCSYAELMQALGRGEYRQAVQVMKQAADAGDRPTAASLEQGEGQAGRTEVWVFRRGE